MTTADASDLAGYATLKKGFAWEPRDDLAFALGWPHLRLLEDGHPDDDDPEEHVATTIDGSIEGHYFVRWPRQVAARYVRAFGTRGPGAFTLRNAAVAAAANTEAAPLTEDEARAMLADRVRHGGPTGSWFTEHFVLLLEALVGTPATLDGLVTALEGEVGTDEEVEQLGFVTGFLLLRVSPDVAAQQSARLQAVLDRASDDYVHDGLACALGGGAAARSMGLNPVYYHHAVDDPEGVRAAVAAGRWLPSARHVFVGGDPVLETIAPHWKKQGQPEQQRKLALQLAPIASPVAVRILADMAAKSKVKKALPALCAPYLPHLRPELERLAADPAFAPGANVLLT